MQVGEYDSAVVGAGEQVVRVEREAQSANLIGVRLESLHCPSTTHVPQHTRRVLVTARHQSTRRLNAHRRKRTSCTTSGRQTYITTT